MKKSLSNLLEKIYLNSILFVPAAVLVGFVIFYSFFLMTNPPSLDFEKTFLGLDLVSATFAGLLFYASYATKVSKKSILFYNEAERFLHSAARLSVATLLEGYLLLPFFQKTDFLLKKPIELVLTFTTIVFFVLAMGCLIKGIFNLLKILHQFQSEERGWPF